MQHAKELWNLAFNTKKSAYEESMIVLEEYLLEKAAAGEFKVFLGPGQLNSVLIFHLLSKGFCVQKFDEEDGYKGYMVAWDLLNEENGTFFKRYGALEEF